MEAPNNALVYVCSKEFPLVKLLKFTILGFSHGLIQEGERRGCLHPIFCKSWCILCFKHENC